MKYHMPIKAAINVCPLEVSKFSPDMYIGMSLGRSLAFVVTDCPQKQQLNQPTVQVYVFIIRMNTHYEYLLG